MAHESLSALVAALPDPVLVLNAHGTVLMANCHMTDLLAAEPVGHHISLAIRAPAVLGALATTQQQAHAQRVDYEVHGPVPRHFEAYIAPIAHQAPEQPASLLVIRDLTREQQLERMRADFVANASHELRTPLASLTGFIETLLGAARNDVEAREKFLHLMRNQAERMRRLIDDLLSLSRIEMNAYLKPSGQVDMAHVARHVTDSLAIVARDANIELQVHPMPVLEVTGDWDELVQVLLNLVENAIKYSGPQSRVEISGSEEAGFVSITVKDQGAGIAAEHIPRLTERFYRINVQESRSRGGTGLGLAIVKHILNRHRGRLSVVSELGVGSQFTIKIPKI